MTNPRPDPKSDFFFAIDSMGYPFIGLYQDLETLAEAIAKITNLSHVWPDIIIYLLCCLESHIPYHNPIQPNLDEIAPFPPEQLIAFVSNGGDLSQLPKIKFNIALEYLAFKIQNRLDNGKWWVNKNPSHLQFLDLKSLIETIHQIKTKDPTIPPETPATTRRFLPP